MAINPHVAHRGGLATRVRELFPDSTLFSRIGGRTNVAAIVDHLYDRIETDSALRPKFGGNTTLERENQKRFFEEWLGGEPLYSFHVAHRGLRQIHGHIHISSNDAARWLGHFEKAMQEAAIPETVRREVLSALRPLARALVNEDREAQGREHRCSRGKPWTELGKAAEKGDVRTVRQAITRDPRLLGDGGCALQTLLFRAAAGRKDVRLVKTLLGYGANATRIGVGRWVLDPALCKLLLSHGADVEYACNPWASWIWQSCTGNHNQKDDPEYVRALISHGVDVNSTRWWGKGAG